mgnify:FL=1
MNRLFIRRNINAIAIFIFIAIFILIRTLQPSFIYEKDGSFRRFGLGTKKKTILPIWLVTIILGFFSYLFVLYYLAIPKIKY